MLSLLGRRRLRTAQLMLLALLIVTFVLVSERTSWDEKTAAKRVPRSGIHKLILVYTEYRFAPWAPTIKKAADYEFTDWDGAPCEERRCEVTYDKGLLNVSDAVLVHGLPLPQFSVQEMTANRPAHQRWVYYVKESPGSLGGIDARFDGIFNWTATYRKDSDFFVPYGAYVEAEPIASGEEAWNFALNRDKMAAFGASSHCTGQRFAFVRALMKHIPVSVFGKCAPDLDPAQKWHCPHNLGQGCAKELARHKFYLAFENSNCKDYLTEKYWRNSLQRNLVPVVLGGSGYGPDLAIPGSFINAADFDSVKALADYLKYLDKNDTAYNAYFEWKRKYKVVKYQYWFCGLCKALHDPGKPVQIYSKLSVFWGVEETCKIGTQHIWNMIHRGWEKGISVTRARWCRRAQWSGLLVDISFSYWLPRLDLS